MKIHFGAKTQIMRQVGAELCQVQLKLSKLSWLLHATLILGDIALVVFAYQANWLTAKPKRIVTD